MTSSKVTGTLGSWKRVSEVMTILTVPCWFAVKDSPLPVSIVTGLIHSMVWNREMSTDRWLVVTGTLGSQKWVSEVMLDPVPNLISDNQHPALDCTRLISGYRTSLNPLTFDHANSIQATSIINMHSALIADAIGLSITLSLTLPELVNPLCSLLS